MARKKRSFPLPPNTGRTYAQKKRAKQSPSALVTVTLQMRHSVNGRFYGPGTVTVTRHKAESFLATESLATEKEQSLQQQQAYIITNNRGVIGKRQVPWAQFDDILGQTEVRI